MNGAPTFEPVPAQVPYSSTLWPDWPSQHTAWDTGGIILPHSAVSSQVRLSASRDFDTLMVRNTWRCRIYQALSKGYEILRAYEALKKVIASSEVV